MADSDHSMNYACVTRRVALLGGSAAVTGGVLGNASSAIPLSSFRPDDPVITLWHDWAATHLLVQELSQLMQKLEVEVAERFDSFGTLVPVPGCKPVYVHSLFDLNRLIGERTDMGATRLQAERELAAKQAEFDAISSEVGYFSTMKAEQAAFSHAKTVLDAMITTPAMSLAGVAGKLDAIGRWGEAWDERPDTFPWPHIQSAHADLVRLGKQLTPNVSYPAPEA
ncbi:hypothetical protein [Tianweitania sp.]|uniref:hypothetical protein n=1 Tax=Tianweitania sp. TaxID=2021634 RepID=UPI0028991044|nr:hypothetical protein [Tianweitania sp.]